MFRSRKSYARFSQAIVRPPAYDTTFAHLEGISMTAMTSTSMMIRSYRPRVDLPQIVRLIREELAPLSANPVKRDALTRRKLAARLTRGAVFVAASGRTAPPDGFIHVMTANGMLQIDMLAVSPERRSRRLGTRLMTEAESYGKARGCYAARLYVDDTNDRAQRFYARSGYRPVRYLPALRCYEMVKQLLAYQ